jgi:hypothetical protein
MEYEDRRERLIEHCGNEPPEDSLIKLVRDTIGFPPKALLYTQLIRELPEGIDEDEVCRCLDKLYADGDIDITEYNWIHGVKKIDTSKWTKDDWDWIYGTGRFAQ